jgi:hypothetical protein
MLELPRSIRLHQHGGPERAHGDVLHRQRLERLGVGADRADKRGFVEGLIE